MARLYDGLCELAICTISMNCCALAVQAHKIWRRGPEVEKRDCFFPKWRRFFRWLLDEEGPLLLLLRLLRSSSR